MATSRPSSPSPANHAIRSAARSPSTIKTLRIKARARSTTPKEKQGIGILEPDLAGSPHNESSQSAAKSTQPGEDIVTRRPNDDVRKYELEDDGDRWVLITKPDPKTEQSIQFAFSEALARQ